MPSLSPESRRALIKEANRHRLNAQEVDDFLMVSEMRYADAPINPMLYPDDYYRFYVEKGDEYLVPKEELEEDNEAD